MLPSVDDAWLTDRDGARYLCELRLTGRHSQLLNTDDSAAT
jgi:hypothetical protein